MAKQGGDVTKWGWSSDFLPENADDGLDSAAFERAIREARMDDHDDVKWGLRLVG